MLSTNKYWAPAYKIRLPGNCAPLIYKVFRNDCRGFNNLQPRSPDATPRDFFPWG